jgi:CheY-like chemotaxis protein
MALILIIDDSSYQRRLVRKYIEADGHQTLEAGNGRDGLEMITTHTPDCVLLDLIMPDSNGLDLLEALHKQGADVPVAVITADVQTSTHKQCIDLGAVAILNKPVDSTQLRHTLSQILDSKERETS